MHNPPFEFRKRPGHSPLRLIIAVLTAFIPSMLSTAKAQVFYSYPGAPVVVENHVAAGPFVAAGNHFFRMGGFGRFNISTNVDMGIELTVDGVYEEWFAGAGGDIRYAITPESYEIPFDWSANAGIGFISGNNSTTVLIPIGSVISRSLELAEESILTPYGGPHLLILRGSGNTDIDFEFRVGAKLELDNTLDVFSALHVGYGTKFYLGLNVRL